MSEEIYIDVAVMCQDYIQPVISSQNNHTIILDDIYISPINFKNIFYFCSETFGVNKNILENIQLNEYITFSPSYRTYQGEPFYLLDTILKNIEVDLGIHRNCFTSCSLIEFSRDITNIKTLANINTCNVTASITWSNIIQIVKNNYYSKQNNNIDEFVIRLVITVVFKTPCSTEIVPNIIKFYYNINDINYFLQQNS